MIHFLPLQEGYENIADREQIVREIKKNRESEYRAPKYSQKVLFVGLVYQNLKTIIKG